MELGEEKRKLMIGLVMGGILLLQAVATFGTLFGLHARSKFWPWTNYPMYEQKSEQGDRIDVTGIIFVVLDSGGRIQIKEEDLNIGFWKFFYLYNRLSLSEEALPMDIDMVLKSTVTESEIVAIETYNYPLIIDKKGAVEVESTLRKRIDIEQ